MRPPSLAFVLRHRFLRNAKKVGPDGTRLAVVGVLHLPMKPDYDVEWATRLSRSDGPKRRRSSFPRIAFEFQAPREGDFNYGGGRPNRPRGFTLLAREVFRRRNRRTFGVETVVLGTITLATAWQIAAMLREVFIVLKNGGIY